MKILVTGATGLVGKVLTERMKDEHKVYALARTLPQALNEGVEYIQLDLSDAWTIGELPKRVDAIVHLSQSDRFRSFPESTLDVFSVNVDSTARLLDYAYQAKASKFFYASSGGVYGNGRAAFKENSPIEPSEKLGYYLGSKLCGEILSRAFSKNFQVVIGRFFFVYGPEQKRSMLIPRLVDNVRKGIPLQLTGENGIVINPIHVEDAVSAVIASLTSNSSSTYNIGGSEHLSLRQIGEAIGKVLSKSPLFETDSGEPADLIGDNRLMVRELHKPEIKFSEGILELI